MRTENDFALRDADWPAFVLDEAGHVHASNRGAESAFGTVNPGTDLPLRRAWSSANAANWDAWWLKARGGGLLAPAEFVHKGGSRVSYLVCVALIQRATPRSYLVQLIRVPGGNPVAAGAGELKAETTDAALAHKQKLDCALQLTRTVALDFNNALTSILGHTSLLLSKMELGHPFRGSLLEVEKSAEKAAEIAFDLAAFSRQEKESHAHTAGNLNQLLRRTVELFQSPGSPVMDWSLNLEPQLFTTQFDEAKMQQALMKILDNAVQAAGPGGRVQVSSTNRSLSETTQDESITLAPGHYVCVEVGDNGGGIDPATLPRVFEPFFTTKAGHRGLGLAWVYGIVTNHGGSVAISSGVQSGTRVRLYLPAQKKIVRDTGLADDDLRGKETVLIVDDEELLLTMGQMLLSEFGYRVLTASSGEKALEIVARSQQQIDLVITDMVMPGMSGRELIERLRQLAPRLPVLSVSGYIRAPGAIEDEMYLQKPFTSQELLRKVKHALG